LNIRPSRSKTTARRFGGETGISCWEKERLVGIG
jgi:hypothetical protein